MTSSASSQPSLPPESYSGGDRFHEALGICTPYVVGLFDLSARGGPEHTLVVRARSAAHTRKLATRLCDTLGATAEGEAPDGSEPWMVVDADDVVVHLLTEASLHRYGLVDLFAERSEAPDDVYAVAAVERLRRAWASRDREMKPGEDGPGA
jgi:ribosomal silencing factor RsfS